MAITPVHSVGTVTTAGTAVSAFGTASTAIPTSVYFEASGANGGYIYVGLSTVSSTVYITRLAAGQGYELKADAPQGRIGGTGIALSSIWLDTSNSGDTVQMTYMYPIGG